GVGEATLQSIFDRIFDRLFDKLTNVLTTALTNLLPEALKSFLGIGADSAAAAALTGSAASLTGSAGALGGSAGALGPSAAALTNAALVSAVKPFAHGGVISPFAKGGWVVDSPTLFPMAGGAGLMGEAGPEAIMPLTRTSGGDLGVNTSGAGGGGPTIHLH